MNVQIDNKNVRVSGSVVVLDDSVIKFDLGSSFVVVIKFVRDVSQSGKKRQAQVENNELIIKFINYEESLGTSNAALMELGTIGDRRIYLSFALWYLGDEKKHSRVFHYTFLDEKVSN